MAALVAVRTAEHKDAPSRTSPRAWPSSRAAHARIGADVEAAAAKSEAGRQPIALNKTHDSAMRVRPWVRPPGPPSYLGRGPSSETRLAGLLVYTE